MCPDYYDRRLKYEYTITGMRKRWANGTQNKKDIRFNIAAVNSIKYSHSLKLWAYLETEHD